MFSTTKPAVDGRAEASFSKRIRGFTLIEVLVVVAVMAVLMGIVVPAIYTTRELTLEIVCAVNIRQLADAMSQYAAVNEQFAPWRKTIIGRWNDPNAKRLRQSYIFPHLAREEDVFVCPMFLKMTNGVGTFSYTMNWNIGYGNEYNSEQLQRRGQIENPWRLCLFCEENFYIHPAYSNFPINDGQLVSPDWPYRDTFATFHRPQAGRYADGTPRFTASDRTSKYYEGISHVAFVDAHVEWCITTQTERLCHNNPALINCPENR